MADVTNPPRQEVVTLAVQGRELEILAPSADGSPKPKGGQGRRYRGAGGVMPAAVPHDHPHSLRIHAQGTEEANAEILVDIAAYASFGLVSPRNMINVAGSRFQDIKGSGGGGSIQRAHRLVGGVRVNGLDLVDLAGLLSPELMDETAIPCKATDPISTVGNYVDFLISLKGGAAAFQSALISIVHEQKRGTSVHADLVRHEADLLHRRLKLAKLQALEHVAKNAEKDLNAIWNAAPGKASLSYLDQSLGGMESRFRTPSKQTVTAKNALENSIVHSKLSMPWTHPLGIESQVGYLASLATRNRR